jgi:hypothetical protein
MNVDSDEQINNDHETLKQKWNDLRKAIGPE